MKKVFFAVLALAALTVSCNKEELLSAPVITLENESYSVNPGETVKVAGTASAEAGLATITAVCEELGVNFSKDLSAAKPAEYTFSFEVTVPADFAADQTIAVKATDVQNLTAEATVTITLVPDADKPVIDAFKYAYVDSTNSICYVHGVFSDDVALKSVTYKLGGFEYEAELEGTSCEFAEYLAIDGAQGENLEITLLDKSGKSAQASLPVVCDVVAPQVEVIEEPAAVIVDASGKATVTFKAKIIDDYALSYAKVGLFDGSWTAIEDYTVFELSGTSGEIEKSYELNGLGNYIVYVWIEDASIGNTDGSAYWGNSYGAEYDIYLTDTEITDNTAPTVELLSAVTAQVNVPYTLTLKFYDEGGFANCWPKINLYNGNGTEPAEIAANWDGWWPEIPADVTEYTVTTEGDASVPQLTFTEAGEYKVWIQDAKDKAGNFIEAKEWFTITVTE